MDEIKAIEFPDQIFATKEDLFACLKKYESKLISLKKAALKNSDTCNFLFVENDIEYTKKYDGLKDGFVTAVINTTNYMDSHNDVHFPKIWNKSLTDQKGRIYYVTDHDMKVNSVVAYPKDVTMSVKMFKWSDLGASYPGETQALLFEVDKKNIQHEGAKKIIDQKINIQHSVRMQYVDMFLAINSNEKEDKEYKKRFDKYIDQIANKELALERGYFWGQTEAKISQEGSMVLAGSNDITPLLQKIVNFEPPQGTSQPHEGTGKVAKYKVRW